MSTMWFLSRRIAASSRSGSRSSSHRRSRSASFKRKTMDRNQPHSGSSAADRHSGERYQRRGHHHKNQGRRYPDRWSIYDPVGKEMTGTRFVAFKVPLHESFFAEDVHPDEFFDIHTLVRYARDAQRRIGLVIDLTNTHKYYNPRDWAPYDVEYRKFMCPGHEVNEREDIVTNFIECVNDFIRRNKDNNLLIGVHCTHGLNRTGYLICRYLIDVLGWTATQAISTFEECRGHAIERKHYIKALKEAEARRLAAPRNQRTSNDSADNKNDEGKTDTKQAHHQDSVPLVDLTADTSSNSDSPVRISDPAEIPRPSRE